MGEIFSLETVIAFLLSLFIVATTKSTNHYTITAIIEVYWNIIQQLKKYIQSYVSYFVTEKKIDEHLSQAKITLACWSNE